MVLVRFVLCNQIHGGFAHASDGSGKPFGVYVCCIKNRPICMQFFHHLGEAPDHDVVHSHNKAQLINDLGFDFQDVLIRGNLVDLLGQKLPFRRGELLGVLDSVASQVEKLFLLDNQAGDKHRADHGPFSGFVRAQQQHEF